MKVIREHCMISLHVVWFLFNFLLVWHNNVFKLSWQLFAANIDMWLTVINLMWLIAYNIRRTFSVYIHILLNWFKSWMYYTETYMSCRQRGVDWTLDIIRLYLCYAGKWVHMTKIIKQDNTGSNLDVLAPHDNTQFV